MKRKLDENDVPVEAPASAAPNPADSTPSSSFTDLALDPRLLQAIAAQKFATPTPVQAKAIPLALQGKHILARARTGSGKTAAYVLPILQTILKRKSEGRGTRQSTSALILVPTRELANQVNKAVTTLSAFCSKVVHSVNLAPQIQEQAQRALLASNPDVVVSTPSRALQHLNSQTLKADHLAHVVIDEADLVMSYGYEDDFRTLVKMIPQDAQNFLASATLTTEVDTLKGLFCPDPVVLDLQEDEADEKSTVSQYVVKCGEEEKFLLLFAVFKLKLVQGKCIVFVGDVDRCYRVKLFLEQFGIKSCVLNSELPVNCRIHVVEEFNKNVYDIIIATDEHEVMGNEHSKKTSKGKGKDQASEKTSSSTKEDEKSNARPKGHKSREYGISRGIDFQHVRCVLNLDLPPSSKSYTHRIGRTARAGQSGIALSFCVPSSQYRKVPRLSFPGSEHDEHVLAAIKAAQSKRGRAIEPYHMDMAKLSGFNYRVQSALKTVTPGAVRAARVREIKGEMLKSEKLKRFLEENPEDAQWLRHDEETRAARVMPHLKHVPEYLMPNGSAESGLDKVGFVGAGRQSENRIRKARERNRMRGKGKVSQSKRSNPLKTFNAKGKGR